MCLPMDDTMMICWLKTQVRVLEAWRENLAMDVDLDLEQINRLERHYQWLTSEILTLESAPRRAA